MGVIKRQGAKASVISYLGVFVGLINTLWLMPGYLSPEEIGLINLLVSISILIAPLAQLGINGIILKYYPYFKDDKEKEGAFISLVFLIPTIGFTISMLLLFIGKDIIIDRYKDTNPLFIDYLFFIVPISFFIVLKNVMETLSRALYLITVPKIFRELGVRALMFLAILLYALFQLSLDFLVISYTIIFSINVVALIFYLKKIGDFKPNFKLNFFSKDFIKEALKYGSYIILSGVAGLLVTKIDSFMINDLNGLEDTGIYFVSLYIGLAIEMPKRALNQISLPVISQAMKNKELMTVNRLYAKSSLIQLIIGSLILTCVWLNIDDIFSLVPNSEIYSKGKYVVLFIGLAVVFDMATGFNGEIILMSDFYKWNLILMLLLIILVIILNLIFIPLYGITGAAMATALAMFVFNIFKYFVVKVKLKIQPFRLNTLKSLTVTALILTIGYFLPDTSYSLLNIIYKGAILSSVFIFLHLYFKISDDLSLIYEQGRKKLKL